MATDRTIKLPASVKALNCSFSGQESQCQRLIEGGTAKQSVAFAVYDCMARTFAKLLTNAFAETGCKTALLSGGVSGSLLLRELLQQRLNTELFYARSGLSSDNAVGTALLARELHQRSLR